jgi:hypothetical protein
LLQRTTDPALVIAGRLAHILGPVREARRGWTQDNIKASHWRRAMRRFATIALLTTFFLATTAFAADAVVGTWKLNVAKSKFSGTAPKSVTRMYAEGADGTVLDQKMVGADGKEMSMHTAIKYDGKDYPVTGNPDGDMVAAKVIDAHTADFEIKKGGKVVGTVHRVVSADGKTLTVHNKGTHADGKAYDDTLVFDKQ